MENEFCIVLTTTNSDDNKKLIIESLLGRQIAACVQTMPIESHYIWEGKVCSDNEFLLIIKSTQSCYQQVEKCIVELHNYEVPQVVKLPFVDGFNPYLSWLKENTRL
ncbi:divalent-cation tolerance protein CutA [Vibrio ponticus]|uniref:Divalent-cation tolerance protein CutA n=1 Tax=Vibrio ponticus TaxID=265668 RepID=A0A3N3DT77_9VIBR|nr:divalent-cation tolerance protein CutA [Vibrio ponticus]ROV57703.1 divalent-cation tolerance protein CutA [Vibrio ponticus]